MSSAQQIYQSIVDSVASKYASDTYFSAALQNMLSMSASIPGSRAVFFSGTDDGVKNSTLAENLVSEYGTSQYYRLNETEAGSYAASFQINNVFDFTDQQLIDLQNVASAKFALEASGNTVNFLGGTVSASSTWANYEAQIWFANSAITGGNDAASKPVVNSGGRFRIRFWILRRK